MKEALRLYVKRVKDLHGKVQGNEQATKASLIAPLFTLLGYDLADPDECVPEFKPHFTKERASRQPVDWAFHQNGRPIFLVEAKESGTKLSGYDEQLGDYFAKVPDVKLGILTNGVMWWFFSDIIHGNITDSEPFVKWDVLNDEGPPIGLLNLLQKSEFNSELVRTFAQRQYNHNLLFDEITKLLEPSLEFIKMAIANVEKRYLTTNVIDFWKPLVVSAIEEWAKQRTLATILHPPEEPISNTETGERRKKGRGGVTLADLISAGILTTPLNLFRKYKGQPLEATLLPDGKVEFRGVRYDTCSAAAEAARQAITGRRMNTNGWDFWQYRDGAGNRHCLDNAKRRIIKNKEGQPEPGDGQEQPEQFGLRKRFWVSLINRPKAKKTRHANLHPGESNWFAAGSGVRGLP